MEDNSEKLSKISTWLPIKDKEEFKVILKINNSNMKRFLRTCIYACIMEEPSFMKFFYSFIARTQGEKKIIKNHRVMKKVRRLEEGERINKYLSGEDYEEISFLLSQPDVMGEILREK